MMRVVAGEADKGRETTEKREAQRKKDRIKLECSVLLAARAHSQSAFDRDCHSGFCKKKSLL